MRASGRRMRGIFVFGDANSVLMSEQEGQLESAGGNCGGALHFGSRIAARGGTEREVRAEVIVKAVVRIERLVSNATRKGDAVA